MNNELIRRVLLWLRCEDNNGKKVCKSISEESGCSTDEVLDAVEYLAGEKLVNYKNVRSHRDNDNDMKILCGITSRGDNICVHIKSDEIWDMVMSKVRRADAYDYVTFMDIAELCKREITRRIEEVYNHM